MKDLAAEKEKENEAKRPPWRAVSVSTLAKPDKNALLRAKLLDASRFALFIWKMCRNMLTILICFYLDD